MSQAAIKTSSSTPQAASTSAAPTSASTAPPACTWPGHCLGDKCSSADDCDQDWVCYSSVCVQTCTWPDHCLGDRCTTFNDCDRDWVCTNAVCALCTDCDTSPTSSTSSKSSRSTTGSTIETSQGTVSSSSTSSTAAAASYSSSTSPSSIAAPVATATRHDSLSTGAKAGIAVGATLAVIALSVIGFYLLYRRRKRKRGTPELDATPGSRTTEKKLMPVEMGAGQPRSELDGPGKNDDIAPVEMEAPPAELDGQDQRRSPSMDKHAART